MLVVGAVKAFFFAEPSAKQFGGVLAVGKSLPCVLMNTKGKYELGTAKPKVWSSSEI